MQSEARVANSHVWRMGSRERRMTKIEIRILTIDDAAIGALNARARNQLFGCLHAHK
jgi:hypothetical protein